MLEFVTLEGSDERKLAFLDERAGENALLDEGGARAARGHRGAAQPGRRARALRRGPHDCPRPGLLHRHGVRDARQLPPPEIGSVCSGGRYDNLAEYYTDKKLPGVGLSIGVTRLFYVLSEQGLLNGGVVTAPCDAIVLPMTADTAFAAHVATVLRDAGVRTQLYTRG